MSLLCARLLVLALCLAWCGVVLSALFHTLRIPRLEDGAFACPEGWPKLSVVIAACNEAATIEAALQSLLQQDYPQLEIVVVDDRSDDGTGRIVERLAALDNRLVALRVEHLRPGWLGKVHALQAGLERACGEWVLFTDADVHFRPGLLRRSIQSASAQGIDHLVLVPEIVARSFWLKVLVQSFAVGFLHLTGAGRVGEPDSDAVIGAGAFNLVRRAALDRSEGLEWLRMEVADDLGLGLLLQRSGARSRLQFALHGLSVEWYDSVSAMFRGLEKNAFSAAEYSLAKLLLLTAGGWAFALAPLAALTQTGVIWLWPVGAACYLALGLLAAGWRLRLGQSVAPVMLLQVGHFLLSLAVVRAGLQCLRRGGIVWRGTHYPLADLRSGQRVRLVRFRRHVA